MKIVVCASPVEDGHGYIIKAPDLPGCSCKAISVSDGLEKIRRVVDEHLLLLCEYGETIPPLFDIDTHIYNNKNSSCFWLLLELDESAYLGKSHKINVTLPEMLVKKIDDRVSKTEEYKSRSAFLAKAALNELNKAN